MVTIYQPKKKDTKPTFTNLTIERWDHETQGISHQLGKICFVQGALPGEQVQVRLTEQKKDFAKAVVQKVLTPSTMRQAPACRYASECGGCQLQHISQDNALLLKQQAVDALLQHQLKIKTLPWQQAIVSPNAGYRRRARIGVWFDKNSKQFQVGFRKAASHEILDIEACLVLSEVIAPALAVLRETLPKLKAGHAITHVELLDADGQAFVVVRHVKPLTENDQQTLIAAWPKAQWWGEPQTDQYIAWQQQPKPLCYTLDHIRFAFQPTDFIQVNAAVNAAMVHQAIDWLDLRKSDQVLDLYCGIGNFSLLVAGHVAKVTGVEGLTNMVQRAAQNAKDNGIENCEFVQGDLHLPWPKHGFAAQSYDKVLLDPARAGAEVCVGEVARKKPACILYVSCNPTTFARDAKLLLAKNYQLTKIGVMDMFPNTSHLELMALFQLTRQ